MTKHGSSKHRTHDVIDVDGGSSQEEIDSDALNSSSETESDDDRGGRHHHKKQPLQPVANKRAKEGGGCGGGGDGGSTKKKKTHGGGAAAAAAAATDLEVLAKAVQADPSVSAKLQFLFTAVQEQILPQLSYVHGQLKLQEEEDAVQARREETLRKRAAKAEGGGKKRKKRKKHEDSDEESSDEEEGGAGARGGGDGGKKKGGKGQGKRKGKGAFIPMMEKWAKALAAKLEQNGSLGQVPFTKERSISVREHFSVSIDDSEALFKPTGTLMQPTPHNKPHSALHIYKFYGKAVSQLFHPIPFPLKRKARLFTKEGAAAQAAAQAAKKEELEKKKRAKKAEGGGGGDDDDESSKGGESDNEEAEASSGGGGGSKGKGGKKGWEEEEGGEATLKTVKVKITSMEARHNHDKLSLTLVFFFEQAESVEGGEGSDED